jgi:prepilin-type N-terminal cleavage/methylation domain-containing protein
MTNRRAFTLLEVMLVMALLVVAGGAIYWRLDRFVAHHRLETDASRLKSALLHARTLALCSRSDIRLILSPSKKGWSLELQQPEDPSALPTKWPSSLGRCNLFLDDTPAEQLVFQFYSSGHIHPTGTLRLQTDTQNATFSLPKLFKQL